MNFSEDQLQYIEDYLDGKMNAEETAAFESDVQNNPDLANLVSINKSMKAQYNAKDWGFIEDSKSNSVINDLESTFRKEQVRETKKAILEASNIYLKEEQKLSKKKLYAFFAVAASIVVFLGLFFNRTEQANNEIYTQYSDWSELPSLTSRGNEENELLLSGEKAFLDKDYELAIKNFNAAITQAETQNPTALLYLGISQLELNAYDNALSSFRKLIESNTLDHSKGYWYSALVYLKKDERQNAISQLEIILGNADNYNFTEAEKLLKQLKD